MCIRDSNNYVALHYASRHMSWLHCMWGVGASLGPYVMGSALTGGKGWNAGYLTIAVLQIGLTAVLFVSLPLWKKRRGMASEPETVVPEASPAADTADMGSTAAVSYTHLDVYKRQTVCCVWRGLL